VRAEPGVLRTFTAALADAIRRPNLLGALVAKAAAHSVVLDHARARHLVDFAVLTTPLRPSDRTDQAGRRDRKYLEAALAAPAADKRSWASVDGATEGVARLRLALAPVTEAGPTTPSPFTRRRS